MRIAPAADTCWMFLLRHGATANNLERPYRLQGRRTDQPLSEEGVLQSRAAATVLAAYPLTAVFSSPMTRARQTAETIAAAHGLDVSLVPELTECDLGAWEGRTWPEIEQSEPEAFRLFFEDPSIHGYRDGENMAQVAQRVLPALERLLAENLGGVIAVVSHNVVNRVYLGELLHVPPARRRAIPQDNCGLNVIRRQGERTQVVCVNSVWHMTK